MAVGVGVPGVSLGSSRVRIGNQVVRVPAMAWRDGTSLVCGHALWSFPSGSVHPWLRWPVSYIHFPSKLKHGACMILSDPVGPESRKGVTRSSSRWDGLSHTLWFFAPGHSGSSRHAVIHLYRDKSYSLGLPRAHGQGQVTPVST